jgi:hypothetical protein
MIAGKQQLACLLWSDRPGAGIKLRGTQGKRPTR